MGAAKQVVPGFFVIPTGVVNTFLLDAADGCALIDAGLPGRVEDILHGIASAGRRPADVRHLIVTHAHPDHIGSLAAIRAATGAAVYCHPDDGQVLPFAGGLTVVHAPGHCAGQVALLWPAHGGVLLAADAASNVLGLRPSPAYEDFALGEQSLRRLSALDFQVACFGHGKAIVGAAAARFRRRWPVARSSDTEPDQM
jgi:glyoxylase-like metal-dependent hydrolase (beta-lactamase superfamily II)